MTANWGGMFVLDADELKKIEKIAGTCCCGTCHLRIYRDDHSEIYDNFGLAAYLSPEQTRQFINSKSNNGVDE